MHYILVCSFFLLSYFTFRPECYHLLDHNCNTFSDETAQFLCGQHIPAHITNLPKEVLETYVYN